MTNMNLSNFDTIELTFKEQSETDGGFLMLLAAICACVAAIAALIDYARS